MADSTKRLLIQPKVKDDASRALKGLGITGGKAGESIAAGFIKAQLALGAMKQAVRAVASTIKGLTTDVAEQGDQIAKLSRRLGISIETLSAFSHVAQLGGANVQSFGNALKLLTKNAYDASRGTGEAKDVLADLGVEVVDANGQLKTTEDLFFAVADALSGMTNQTERAAAAQRIFGRSGLDVIPIIDQGTDAIRRQIEEAHRYGIVWTDATGKIAENFVDAQTRLDAAINGIKIAIGTELLPALTEGLTRVASFLADHRDEIREFAVQAIQSVSDFIISATRSMIYVFGTIRDVAKKLSDLFGAPRGDTEEALATVGGIGALLAKRLIEGAGAGGENSAEEWVKSFDKKIATLRGAIRKATDITAPSRDAGLAGGAALGDSFAEEAMPGIEKITKQFERQIELLRAESDEKRALLQIDQQIADVLASIPADRFRFPGLDPDVDRLIATLSAFREISRERIMEQTVRDFFDFENAAEGAAKAVADLNEEWGRTGGRSGAGGFLAGATSGLQRFRSEAGFMFDLGDRLATSGVYGFTSFFDSIVFGSQRASDAFRAFATDILRSLSSLATQQLGAQIFSAILGMFGGGGGATARALDPGKYAPAHAFGGIATRPTIGVFGEAGPEAIVPLNRAKEFGGGTTFNMTINAGAGVDPRQVREMARMGVLEGLRSSSTYKNAFRRNMSGGLYG